MEAHVWVFTVRNVRKFGLDKIEIKTSNFFSPPNKKIAIIIKLKH